MPDHIYLNQFFPLRVINQPLVIIIGKIPEKRAVLRRAKIMRDCRQWYAGQNERPGCPILTPLAGASLPLDGLNCSGLSQQP
jgi:hypothetical protein